MCLKLVTFQNANEIFLFSYKRVVSSTCCLSTRLAGQGWVLTHSWLLQPPPHSGLLQNLKRFWLSTWGTYSSLLFTKEHLQQSDYEKSLQQPPNLSARGYLTGEEKIKTDHKSCLVVNSNPRRSHYDVIYWGRQPSRWRSRQDGGSRCLQTCNLSGFRPRSSYHQEFSWRFTLKIIDPPRTQLCRNLFAKGIILMRGDEMRFSLCSSRVQILWTLWKVYDRNSKICMNFIFW